MKINPEKTCLLRRRIGFVSTTILKVILFLSLATHVQAKGTIGTHSSQSRINGHSDSDNADYVSRAKDAIYQRMNTLSFRLIGVNAISLGSNDQQRELSIYAIVPTTEQLFLAVYGPESLSSAALEQAQQYSRLLSTDGAEPIPSDAGISHLRDYITSRRGGGPTIIIGHSEDGRKIRLFDSTEIAIDDIHSIGATAQTELIVLTCYSPDFGLTKQIDVADAYAMIAAARAEQRERDVSENYQFVLAMVEAWKEEKRLGRHIILSYSMFVQLDDEWHQVVSEYKKPKPTLCYAMLFIVLISGLMLSTSATETTSSDYRLKKKAHLRDGMVLQMSHLRRLRRIRFLLPALILAVTLPSAAFYEFGYRTYSGEFDLTLPVIQLAASIPLFLAAIIWWHYPFRPFVVRIARAMNVLLGWPAYFFGWPTVNLGPRRAYNFFKECALHAFGALLMPALAVGFLSMFTEIAKEAFGYAESGEYMRTLYGCGVVVLLILLLLMVEGLLLFLAWYSALSFPIPAIRGLCYICARSYAGKSPWYSTAAAFLFIISKMETLKHGSS